MGQNNRRCPSTDCLLNKVPALSSR